MTARVEFRREQNAYQKALRDRARANGICTTCCVRPAEPSRCRCVECNQRHRKQPRLDEQEMR